MCELAHVISRSVANILTVEDMSKVAPSSRPASNIVLAYLMMCMIKGICSSRLCSACVIHDHDIFGRAMQTGQGQHVQQDVSLCSMRYVQAAMQQCHVPRQHQAAFVESAQSAAAVCILPDPALLDLHRLYACQYHTDETSSAYQHTPI